MKLPARQSADVDQNEADADAAIAAEEARVDALIVMSGMWLYADQADSPPQLITTVVSPQPCRWGRCSMPTVACGISCQKKSICKPQSPQSTMKPWHVRQPTPRCLSLGCTEADLTTRLQLQLAMPSLSSANSYTDTAVSNVIEAPRCARHLGRNRRRHQRRCQCYTTLVSQIAAVQSDVDGNETDSDAAEAALSGRLDVLEATPRLPCSPRPSRCRSKRVDSDAAMLLCSASTYWPTPPQQQFGCCAKRR